MDTMSPANNVHMLYAHHDFFKLSSGVYLVKVVIIKNQ